MSAISWSSGTSANWNVAADWSTGTIPTSADDVTIAAAGTYTVTISDPRAAHSLTLNSAGATVTDSGTLALGGTMALTAGAFTLASGGLLSGGTVVAGGAGTLIANGGTLSGVTYQGTLDLSQSPSNAHLTISGGGLALSGAGGTGAATVQLTGSGDDLYFTNSAGLNNATINIGNVSAFDQLINNASGITLTLGPQLLLQQSSTYAAIYNEYANDTAINSGTIIAGVSGGQFQIDYGAFTNQGSFGVSNGDTVTATLAAVSNAGTITVNGGVLSLGTWSNTGLINLSAGTLLLGNSTSGAWTNGGAVDATGGTLSLGGSFTAVQFEALAISNTMVDITGSFNNTGNTLAVGTGTSLGTVDFSGTIAGGVISDTGGGLVVTTGTLSGVTYQGTLDLSQSPSNAHLTISGGGLALSGAGGTGAATVQLTGSGDDLYFTNSAGLNNATINIGNVSAFDQLINNASGITLTLGPQLLLQQSSTYAAIYNEYANDTAINSGTIIAGVSGGQFQIDYGAFTNQGSFGVSNGDTVTATLAAVSNAGTITVNGGVLSLGTWSNTGLINLSAGTLLLGNSTSGAWTNGGAVDATGGTLSLGGSFTAVQFEALAISNTMADITGSFNNTGNTLAVGTGTSLGTVDFSGTIAGGVISDTGGGLVVTTGTLSGVTYQGTLDLSQSNAHLTISGGGLALSGAGGTGAATVQLTGSGDDLYFTNSAGLNNATINIGNVSAFDQLINNASGITLTLGPQLLLQQSSTYAAIYNEYANDTAINSGTIIAGVSGGQFQIDNGTFTNQGSISVANGDTLNISTAILSNLSGGTLTGGSYSVGSGSLLQLANNASIVTDAASVTLSGTGSVIQFDNTSTGTQTAIDSTLQSIATTGTLTLQNGRLFTAVANSGTFGDAGNLVLSASRFVATTLTINGGTIAGTGTIASTIVVSGAATATGGTLALNGTVSGSGSLLVALSALLDVNEGGALTGAVTDNGVLALDGTAFAATSITIGATGSLIGFGTIGGTVTDSGLIDATGGTLAITGLAGLAASTWSGAGIEADAGSALQLANNTTIATDRGAITLSGSGSVIESLNTVTSQDVLLDSTLSTIVAGGTLDLRNGRNFTAVANAGTFSDAGLLSLGGGTFTATNLTLNTGATLYGNGTVTAIVNVAGSITASGGLLALDGSLSGAGTLKVAAGEHLGLNSGGVFTGTVNDAGTLQLSGTSFAVGSMTISMTGTVNGSGTITGSVTNRGLLNATGGTLSVTGLAGLGGGTLSAEQIEVATGSVLELGNNTTISGDAGDITLAGIGSLIQSLNTTTSKQVSLASTLSTIAAGGTLTVENGLSFAATANGGNFTDAGVLFINGGTFSAAAITITATGTLIDDGTVSQTISNAGTVIVDAGSVLTLAAGGSLGGTFAGAGSVELTGATPFRLSRNSVTNVGLLAVTSGSTLTGSGTITNPLDIEGSVIASEGSLVLDGSLTGTGTLVAAAGGVLQLEDGGTFFGTVDGAGGLVNTDLIISSTQGASFTGPGPHSIVNSATAEIDGEDGDGVDLAGGTEVITNAGAIGGTGNGLNLSGTSSTVINSGLITGMSGAGILAAGPGTVNITNTGLIADYNGAGVAAISLDGAVSATVTNAGTIIGGYYQNSPGSAIQFGSGNDRLIVVPGAVFVGTVRGGGGSNTLELAAPAIPGTIGTISGLGTSFTGFGSIVEDAATWELANANNLTAAATVGIASGGTLTLDGTLDLPGGAAIGGAGAFLIDANGTLQAGSDTATIDTQSFTNQGLLDVTSGGSLTLGSATFGNLTAGTLTGGTFETDGGATLQLVANAAVTADDANIVLNGTVSAIQWLNTSTSKTTALAQSLTTIGTTGTLQVLNGASFVGAGTVTDLGLLTLVNGGFTAGTLAVSATGTAIGTGTISGAIVDQGLVEASGGTLTLAGNVSGAGTIEIDANSMLSASGTIGVTGLAFLSDGGTLALAQPGHFTATISGFATSDAIDLIDVVATGATFANNTLTLTGAGGSIGQLLFTGNFSGYQFGLSADGNGGTKILLG